MNPKKIILASDSFKGSLTQEEILSILTEEAKKQFPDCECEALQIADGGEGTVRAIAAAAGGELKEVSVHDPLMNEHTAVYGILPNGRAIIEMAEASGLPLVPMDLRDPRNTSSYGTGELIKDAVENGCRDIRIALGGSATNDGGLGALRALGFRFLDQEGNELEGFGRDLINVASIDTEAVSPDVYRTNYTIMCDVNNPLTGPEGATYTFGPQKGGSPEILEELEAGMVNFSEVMAAHTGERYDRFGGTGAAGGLGFAVAALLKGKIRSGIETMLDLIDFNKRIFDANLCITGEGRLDDQSMHGKAIHGIAKHCKQEGIPCIAIVGDVVEGYERIYLQGVTSVYKTTPAGMSTEQAMADAARLYRQTAERVFKDLASEDSIGG